jgi:hypothetical protein
VLPTDLQSLKKVFAPYLSWLALGLVLIAFVYLPRCSPRTVTEWRFSTPVAQASDRQGATMMAYILWRTTPTDPGERDCHAERPGFRSKPEGVQAEFLEDDDPSVSTLILWASEPGEYEITYGVDACNITVPAVVRFTAGGQAL